MNGFAKLLAVAAVAALVVPLTAQQEVPMRNNTPVAPQGIKIPPLPETPVTRRTSQSVVNGLVTTQTRPATIGSGAVRSVIVVAVALLTRAAPGSRSMPSRRSCREE